MDEYAHLAYSVTKSFPKSELFGITSQLRRSALSVTLNYIEGYARFTPAMYQNFLRISFGSLQESKYLIEFSLKEEFLSQKDYDIMAEKADNIGAMLWGMIKKNVIF